VNLWQELRGRRDGLPIGGPDAYVGLLNNSYSYGGGFTQTLTDGRNESIGTAYAQVAGGGYANNGVVFSCMAVRQHVFSAVRFQWQRIRQGRPSDLFGSADLRLLEEPWPGGTTQDLLARLIQDADLAGNSYWTRDGGELVRLRPDWVEIVLEPRLIRGARVGWRRIGYLYYEGGGTGENRDNPAVFSAVGGGALRAAAGSAGNWRGMSWLTPVLREIESDALMGRHKRKFFENGATPNMVVKHPPRRPRTRSSGSGTCWTRATPGWNGPTRRCTSAAASTSPWSAGTSSRSTSRRCRGTARPASPRRPVCRR
jgi:hypothetical protein